MNRIKSITSLEEFVWWSNASNLCVTSKERVILQDIFAYSTYKDLLEWFISKEANTHRRILLFGIYKSMGDDQFIVFVKHLSNKWANNAVEEVQKDLSEREEVVYKKEKELVLREEKLGESFKFVSDQEKRWRKSAYKKINELEGKCGSLKKCVTSLLSSKKNLELQLESKKFESKPKRMVAI